MPILTGLRRLKRLTTKPISAHTERLTMLSCIACAIKSILGTQRLTKALRRVSSLKTILFAIFLAIAVPTQAQAIEYDKAAHFGFSYILTDLFDGMYTQLGLKPIPSILLGASTALLVGGIKELIDMRTGNHQFDGRDMLFNAAGVASKVGFRLVMIRIKL